MNQDPDDLQPWREDAWPIWEDFKDLVDGLKTTERVNLLLAISIAVQTAELIMDTIRRKTKWD